MSTSGQDLQGLFIDKSLIEAICEAEWEAFLADDSISPVPEKQDLRGFFLNWVAVFLPEAFPPALEYRMADWMARQLVKPDEGWSYVHPPLIGSTLFALTGSSHWLRFQRENFADGGASARTFFHKSLALVAPQMEFDSQLLLSLNRGMEIPFFFMDYALALYVVSKGDHGEKLINFKRWSTRFMNPDEAALVSGILSHGLVPNPFLSWLLEKLNYVALRMACSRTESAIPENLPLRVDFSDPWQRTRKHPLFRPYIELDAKSAQSTQE